MSVAPYQVIKDGTPPLSFISALSSENTRIPSIQLKHLTSYLEILCIFSVT